LPYLEKETVRRQEIARIYRSGINNPLVTLPQVEIESAHVWHLFVVRTEVREELKLWLTGQGVQTLIHYPIPPHQQQAYPQFRDCQLPVTEQIHQQVLSLPMDPTMSNEAVEKVIDAVNGFKA
jgi:dTDP-4-amino-4,6-dideoxygalactose transaminase